MPELYSLASISPEKVKKCKTHKRIFIAPFNASAQLETTRIPSLDVSQHIRYIAGIAWVDQPSRLLLQELNESIQNLKGNCIEQIGNQFEVRADYRMDTDLQEFTYLRDEQAVWMRAEMRLIQLPSLKLIKRLHFNKKIPVAEARISPIMNGFNKLSQSFFTAIIEWLK